MEEIEKCSRVMSVFVFKVSQAEILRKSSKSLNWSFKCPASKRKRFFSWPLDDLLSDLLLLSDRPYIDVVTSLLQWSLDSGMIPLICPVGRDTRGCSVILDQTEVTAAVSRALQPHKVMFLNHCGGLRSPERKAGTLHAFNRKTSAAIWHWISAMCYGIHFKAGKCGFQVLDTVSLPADLPRLSTASCLSEAERRKVTTITKILNQLPAESSAVITSADTLLSELFSHRGELLPSSSWWIQVWWWLRELRLQIWGGCGCTSSATGASSRLDFMH